MTQKAAINGLYAITPDVIDTSELVAMTQRALEGGVSVVQYRNKAADSDLRLHQAHSLARLCQDFQVPFIVNDHLDLAITVGADGVHLGGEDTPLAEARRRLGAGKIVGISCYDQLDRAVEAEQHGADYVAFGAFFPRSPSLERRMPRSTCWPAQGRNCGFQSSPLGASRPIMPVS